MNRLNKTESAVCLYCMSSLFLKDPFFSRLFWACRDMEVSLLSVLEIILFISIYDNYYMYYAFFYKWYILLQAVTVGQG